MSTQVPLETLRFLQERMDWLSEHFWLGLESRNVEVSPELRQAIKELHDYLFHVVSDASEQEKHLTRQNERLAVLAALSLVDKDLPSLLEHVVEVTTELLPARGGSSVVLWDGASEQFLLLATSVLGQTPERVRSSIRTQGGATRWIMDHRRARIVPDVSRDEFGDAPMLAEFGLKALVGVPLIFANEVLGVLYAFDKDVRAYSQDDVHFMTILAGRVANAIYLTRLLEKTQSALSNSQALVRVSSSLIAPADNMTSLQHVTETIAQALSATRVLLMTFDTREKQITRFVVGGHERTSVIPDPFEEYMEGLTGWVMRERKAALSTKDSPDPRESLLVQKRRSGRRVGSIMVAPLMFEDHVYGTLTVVRDRAQDDFSSNDLAVMEELASQAAIMLRNSELYEETKYLATIDDLTGALNRRQLFELGERELKRHHRLHHPLAALMFDIDFFKKVNDQHGHAVGDEVLRILCERATQQTREIDILGRYGGEEFVVLLPETELKEALEIAERLRLVASDPVQVAGLELTISISVGVAAAHHDQSLSHLLQRADTALYQAKREGRNRVVAAFHLPTEQGSDRR
jgi:diguanylate cyclase (GGDEF)-like protein